jgi:hypothetical protein
VVHDEGLDVGWDGDAWKLVVGFEFREVEPRRSVGWVAGALDVTGMGGDRSLVKEAHETFEYVVDGNVPAAAFPPTLNDTRVVTPKSDVRAESEYVENISACEFKANRFGPPDVPGILCVPVPSWEKLECCPEIPNDDAYPDC